MSISNDVPPDASLTTDQVGTTTIPLPAARTSRRGKGFLAVAASIACTGLGQFIAGRRRRGLIWFGGNVGLHVLVLVTLARPELLLVAFGLLVVAVFWVLASWVDAYRCGRNSPHKLGRPTTRYAASVLILTAFYFVPFEQIVRVCGQWWLAQTGVALLHISGGSMSPTAQDGDHVIAYPIQEIHRWDVVILTLPDKSSTSIKRVVGLPHESVAIDNGEVLIDGQIVQRPRNVAPYVNSPVEIYDQRTGRYLTSRGVGKKPVTLGDDEYFVVGDHSERSIDSRNWPDPIDGHPLGALPRARIRQRATAVYWPPGRIRYIE